MVDRWNIYDFHIRGNLLLMDIGAAPAGEGANEGDRENALEFRHISAMTPETETTSHYHFTQLRNFNLEDEELDKALHDTIVNAFHEDKDIIDAQQRVISSTRDVPMMPISADKALLHIRRKIEQIIAEDQQILLAAE